MIIVNITLTYYRDFKLINTNFKYLCDKFHYSFNREGQKLVINYEKNDIIFKHLSQIQVINLIRFINPAQLNQLKISIVGVKYVKKR